MPSHLIAVLGVLLAACCGASADGCADVTIANAADAETLRKNCRVIQGDLVFEEGFSETINLDGVETVEGSISHTGCILLRDDNCAVPKPFTISSSTLTTVNGSVGFVSFHGLESLILPNLTTVNEGAMFQRMDNLTNLDLTQLSYVGWVILEAERLQTLLIDGLKGFTGGRSGAENGHVTIWNVGEVESVDGFFKNPLEPALTDPDSEDFQLSIGANAMPKVRKLTLGWTKVAGVSIEGTDLTVILGGPSTKSMEIELLRLRTGVAGLERSSDLENLTATTLSVMDSSDLVELTIPFDRLSNFSASQLDSLRTIELPQQATGWANLTLSTFACPALNLTTEYVNDSTGLKRRTWYWPEKDIRTVDLMGLMSNDFFASFLEYRTANKNSSTEPRVLERFHLLDSGSQLDCAVFDQLQDDTGILSPDYLCHSDTKDNAASLSPMSILWQQPWQLGLLVLGMLVPLL